MLSQSGRTKPTLEIIPETRFLVFHGDIHSARAVTLRGVVRLTAPESTTIRGIKVRLEGKRRIGWYFTSGVSSAEMTDKKIFMSESKSLATAPGTFKVKSGVTDWPFEFTLPADTPESIEGFASTWLVYNLYADLERPGWNQKDLHATSHIRLVRTLGSDQMDTTRSRTNADIWANKVSYSISIPSDAVVFGTSIVADVELSPLRKGIVMGKVDMRLTETVVKRIAATDTSDVRSDRTKTDEYEVAKSEMEFPEDSRLEYAESLDNPTMEDERYFFKARLPLPKSLKDCRQDVDTHNINITHKLKLMVNIHNPEGHTSQLVCRLPVKLFISPNLPIDDQNRVQAGTTPLSEEELNDQEVGVNAPPVYGQHQLDELYDDIMPSGYMTTLPSGFVTPNGLLSRRGSDEITIDPLHTSSSDTNISNQLNTAALRSRLASLQRNDRPIPQRNHTHSGTHTASHSNPHSNPHSHSHTPHSGPSTAPSRRGSNEHPPTTSSATPPSRTPASYPDLPHLAASYNMDDLSRIPSYSTAIRSTGAITPFSETPPSYFEATSRPASPVLHAASPPRRGSPPDAANAGLFLGPSRQAHHPSGSPRSASGVTSPAARAHGHGHGQHGLTNRAMDEGDVNLRMLRGRS